jgi:hypothetical protein
MANLILQKVTGTFNQADHHKIAEVVALASKEAEIKVLVADVLTPKADIDKAKADAKAIDDDLKAKGITDRVADIGYAYGIGLIMEKDLLISTLSKDLVDLNSKVVSVSKAK